MKKMRKRMGGRPVFSAVSVRLLTVLVLLSLSAIGGCSGAAAGPEGAAEAFMDALGELDVETAKAHATEESQQLLEFLEAMAAEMPEAEKEQMQSADFTVVSSEIDGDNAVVVLDSEGEESTLNMKKVDGKWKVDLSKEDLQKEM